MCLYNVRTDQNVNLPKTWLLLLKMVDRDHINLKLKKKIYLGGEGAPKGLFWGNLMAPQQKLLKIWILRAFKLMIFAKYDVQALYNYILGSKKYFEGSGGPTRGLQGVVFGVI